MSSRAGSAGFFLLEAGDVAAMAPGSNAGAAHPVVLGAKLDDLVLKDYREEIAPASPLVRLLEPRSQAHPYYIQYGWTAPEGQAVKLPGSAIARQGGAMPKPPAR